jgi:CBS domain-containing membrane protein
MTRSVYVLHEENDLALAEKGLDQFRFRHLPVVDGDKLVGIVSERDLLRASISSLDGDHALKDHNLKRWCFVAEIMTRNVLSVRPEMPLAEALALLLEKGIGCLPVTSEDGTLVGIVTQSDFLKLLARRLDEGELAAVSGEVTRDLRSAS